MFAHLANFYKSITKDQTSWGKVSKKSIQKNQFLREKKVGNPRNFCVYSLIFLNFLINKVSHGLKLILKKITGK
jgi:hypothetical protein